jgi:hypothetical protein
MMSYKYRFSFMVFLFCTFKFYAQNEIQIPLNTSEIKPKDTYTIKVNDSTSMHVSVASNKSDHKLKFTPRLLHDKSLVELKWFDLEPDSEVLGNHINGNDWVILYSHLNNNKKEYYLTQYNLISQTLSKEVPITFDMNAKLFPMDHFTATINLDIEKSKLEIDIYENIDRVKEKTFTLATELQDALTYESEITDMFMDYIPSDRYTDVGSLNKSHFYWIDDTYYFTIDVKSKQTTYLIKANVKDENVPLEYGKFTNTQENNKQMRSFLLDGKLFQFSVSNKLARITIFDIETEKVEKEIDYTKEVFGPYHSYYEKSYATEANPSKFLNSFNRFKITSSYIPNIFISVNKGVEETYIIKAGHVNEITYHYNDFWWMQRHMMMMQPNIPTSLPRGFGPNQKNIPELYIEDTEESIIHKTYFMLVVDKNFIKTDYLKSSIYNNYDVESVQKKINDLKFSKFVSTIQIGPNMWYTYYNKDTKNIMIGKIRIGLLSH